jgi:hypothetical protein
MDAINPKDYLETLRAMVTGQSWKIQHKGCSESKALSVKMDVEGYLFHCFKCGANARSAIGSAERRRRKHTKPSA